MKHLSEFLVNESVVSDEVLNSIQELLNKYLVGKYFDISIREIFDIDSKERQSATAYGFDTSDELLADVAGYLIEVFVWTKLNKELFSDSKFLDIWYKDVANAEMYRNNASTGIQSGLNMVDADERGDGIASGTQSEISTTKDNREEYLESLMDE